MQTICENTVFSSLRQRKHEPSWPPTFVYSNRLGNLMLPTGRRQGGLCMGTVGTWAWARSDSLSRIQQTFREQRKTTSAEEWGKILKYCLLYKGYLGASCHRTASHFKILIFSTVRSRMSSDFWSESAVFSTVRTRHARQIKIGRLSKGYEKDSLSYGGVKHARAPHWTGNTIPHGSVANKRRDILQPMENNANRPFVAFQNSTKTNRDQNLHQWKYLTLQSTGAGKSPKSAKKLPQKRCRKPVKEGEKDTGLIEQRRSRQDEISVAKMLWVTMRGLLNVSVLLSVAAPPLPIPVILPDDGFLLSSLAFPLTRKLPTLLYSVPYCLQSWIHFSLDQERVAEALLLFCRYILNFWNIASYFSSLWPSQVFDTLPLSNSDN